MCVVRLTVRRGAVATNFCSEDRAAVCGSADPVDLNNNQVIINMEEMKGHASPKLCIGGAINCRI